MLAAFGAVAATLWLTMDKLSHLLKFSCIGGSIALGPVRLRLLDGPGAGSAALCCSSSVALIFPGS